MATIQQNVTCSVATTGNLTGLCLTLSSILSGLELPAHIVIRHEGSAEFSNFYLEQLIDWARNILGVHVCIEFAPRKGVRATRQAQLDRCQTQFLWIADDDVFYDHRFLDNLCRQYRLLSLQEVAQGEGRHLCYVCGAKPDINDRTGQIPGFKTVFQNKSDLKSWTGEANLHWGDPDLLTTEALPMKYPDMAVTLLDVEVVKAKKVTFQPFESDFSSAPGEDSIFGIQVTKAGGCGFFIPSAQALHLSKSSSRFNESVTRAEMVIRSAECLGVSTAATLDFPPGNSTR